MSTPTSSNAGATASASRGRTLRRLHSLAGLVALGGFLVVHLANNAAAVYGRAAYTRAWARVITLPAFAAIEVAFIALPLAFHAGYGVWLAVRGSRPAAVTAAPVWSAVAQRVSALAALAFVAAHLWHYRIARLRGAIHWRDYYYHLATALNDRGTFALYALGVTATTFHFANGLWRACGTWGLARDARATRRAAWVCGAVGLVLWALGVNTLLHFALRCGGVLPAPARDLGAVCRVVP